MTAAPVIGRKWPQRIARGLLLFPAVSIGAVFFSTTPSRGNAFLVLETLGLVAALVLAFVVGMPTCVTYQDLINADQRYGWNDSGWAVELEVEQPGYSGWWRRKAQLGMGVDIPPSMHFAMYTALSVFFLTSSLLAIIIIYIYLALADISDDSVDPDMEDEEEQNVPDADAMPAMPAAAAPTAAAAPKVHVWKPSSKVMAAHQIQAWYVFAKYAYALATVMLIAGVATWFAATFYLYALKFPDYLIAINGSMAWFAWDSTYAIVTSSSIAVAITVIVASFLMGLANFLVQRLLDRQNAKLASGASGASPTTAATTAPPATAMSSPATEAMPKPTPTQLGAAAPAATAPEPAPAAAAGRPITAPPTTGGTQRRRPGAAAASLPKSGAPQASQVMAAHQLERYSVVHTFPF